MISSVGTVGIVGLMGIGVGLVVVSILRTLRALRLFELGRWREGMSLSLFVFRNDAWLLYWRACCYFWALGETKKNVARAFQLFEKATKRGNVEALSVLGWMSERGLGCKLNMDTSKLYYQKSEAHKSNLINWLAQRTYRK